LISRAFHPQSTEVEICIQIPAPDTAATAVEPPPSRLLSSWEAEYRGFWERDLSGRDYVYAWADGVHFRIRLEEDRLCALVIIGVRPDGTKELLAMEDG
jgi:hypothetical protein